MEIKIDRINKSFCSKDGEVKSIFTNLSLTISEPDFITIIGPNGCGKSTLLNLIAGIEKPDSGTIKLDHGNTNIGYVWQDYRASLLPWLNVYKNVEFPLDLRGIDRTTRRNMIDALFSEFNIAFSPLEEVYKLSGGQQQLVCLLRSIAAQPDLLLCDEPFSALDQSSRLTMAFYLEYIWLKRKIPVLFVSHDIDESILLGSKIMLINKGGQIEGLISNDLPRPRNIDMLNSPYHTEQRKKVIEFMGRNGAIKDKTSLFS